jgi:hypothetical protein
VGTEIINLVSAIGAACAALTSVAAVTAVTVSYVLLRRATDPDVLVYTEQDEAEPRFLYIVIENMGRGIAFNIDFDLSAKLQHEIVWFPRQLTGAFTVGIPNLPPSGKRRYLWGDYRSVMDHLEGRRILCDVSVEGRHYFTHLATHFRNTCVLEAESYRDSLDHRPSAYGDIVGELQKVREKLAELLPVKEQLKDIASRLRDLRQ